MAYPVPLSHHAEHFGWRGNRGPNDSPVHEDDRVTYSVPSTERLLNAKHFSRLPPKSVARQEALWQDTLREGSVRALCQGREYNSSGLTCHLKEAVRARNSIGRDSLSCQRFSPENEERGAVYPGALTRNPVRQRVAVAHGLATGRSCTSLIKLCGPSSTIMLTACATSSGVSTLEGSFRVLPENSVATLPGQTRVTRIPKPRRSSAIHPARP